MCLTQLNESVSDPMAHRLTTHDCAHTGLISQVKATDTA
jgi:hypothetical protein